MWQGQEMAECLQIATEAVTNCVLPFYTVLMNMSLHLEARISFTLSKVQQLKA